MEKVNHPDHYGGDTTYEAIKVIEAWDLGFHLGNAVKYICRADRKGEATENLEKARWYLDREIQRREQHEQEQRAEATREEARGQGEEEPESYQSGKGWISGVHISPFRPDEET